MAYYWSDGFEFYVGGGALVRGIPKPIKTPRIVTEDGNVSRVQFKTDPWSRLDAAEHRALLEREMAQRLIVPAPLNPVAKLMEEDQS
jgi:hypothetical protein